MWPEYIARGQQERRASDGTKSDLVREFHSAGEVVLAWSVTIRAADFPPHWRNINFS